MPKRVLIADNDPASRQLVAASLAHVGAQLIVASSGTEAWSLLRNSRPDLVLLDVGMNCRYSRITFNNWSSGGA